MSLIHALKDIELSSSKDEQRAIVQNFLREHPSQDDLLALTESDAVKHSIDLQYTLKLYFTDMEYKKTNSEKDNKYDWLFLLASLGSIPSI